VQPFLELYEREGFKIHTRHLDRLLGYFVSDIGVLNQVVTLWGYDSMATRDELRARLYADPAWIAFIPKTTPMIQRMETRILRPTSFSPLR
jgi:hypothetical protein